MNSNQANQSPGVWQYFMLILSIGSLVLLAVQAFYESQSKSFRAFQSIDNIICFVFFLDFIWQLFYARPRIKYLKWGWLDLISSIPIFPEFRIARLARIVRILRVLRGARASKQILSVIFIHRARNTFAVVALGSFVLLLFSVCASVTLEPNAPITDAF